MTMATTMELDKQLQALVDARLDTIDRMLLGQIPRSDRLSILREVESQIEELLAERDPASITRDDIIDILRQLDPPEAFVPEEIPDPANRPLQSFSGKRAFATDVRQNQTQTLFSGKTFSRAGLISGILGLSTFFSSFILVIITYWIAVALECYVILMAGFCTIGFVGLGTSVCAIILGIMGRNQGIMPIVGMVTSALSIILCLVVPIFALMML
jgi:hypothetical protein